MPVVMCKPYNEPLPIDPTFDEPATARNLVPNVNTSLSFGGGDSQSNFSAGSVVTGNTIGGHGGSFDPQVLT